MYNNVKLQYPAEAEHSSGEDVVKTREHFNQMRLMSNEIEENGHLD